MKNTIYALTIAALLGLTGCPKSESEAVPTHKSVNIRTMNKGQFCAKYDLRGNLISFRPVSYRELGRAPCFYQEGYERECSTSNKKVPIIPYEEEIIDTAVSSQERLNDLLGDY